MRARPPIHTTALPCRVRYTQRMRVPAAPAEAIDAARARLSQALVLVVVAAACGDNDLPDGLPLDVAHDLAIVAHQDDDLLFMQPDLIEAVRGGAGVVTVYVTAGNAKSGVDYADKRYEG